MRGVNSAAAPAPTNFPGVSYGLVMSLSVPEILMVLFIVVLIFGAGKLPQIGDAVGRSIKNFKRAAGDRDELEVGAKPAAELEKRPAAELEKRPAAEEAPPVAAERPRGDGDAPR